MPLLLLDGLGIDFKIMSCTLNIPCFLFADDNLLFCKATSSACHNLKQLMGILCASSGQLVNFHKPTIIFSKQIQTARKNSLPSHFNRTIESSFGRYLGVYFSSFHPNKTEFNSLLQKTEERIKHWEESFLSKAERCTLIQSTLKALSSYVCSSSLLPVSTVQTIDNIHRQFFWRQQKDKNATPLIAWDTTHKPKAQGGLSLRKTIPFNKALITKLGWKIIRENDNLWVQLIKKWYLQNQNSFTYKTKPNDSHILRKILAQREIVRKGIR